MKKILKNTSILIMSLGMLTSIGVGILHGTKKNDISLEQIKNSEKSNAINFETKKVKNDNIISFQSDENYQLKNFISGDDMCNPKLYDKHNVLSKQTMKTVRNKDWFFNFINDVTGGNGKPVRIIATSTDSDNPITISLETTFRELIGSTQWANNSLIIVGLLNNSKNDVAIHIFKIESNKLIFKSELKSKKLNNLYDVNIPKVKIDGFLDTRFNLIKGQYERNPIITHELNESEWIANPIALSPIVNFDNDKASTQFIVWPLYRTVKDVRDIGIQKLVFENNEWSLKSQELTLPIDKNHDIENSTLLALTPNIEDNKLNLIGHININSKDGIKLDNESIYSIISFGINKNLIELNHSKSIRSIEGNPFAVQPYGLIAKGGPKNTSTKKENLNNIFWILSEDVDPNIPPMIFSTVQDPKTLLFQQENFAKFEMFENNSLFIKNNSFNFDQYSYDNSNDLERGIYISFRARGGDSEVSTKVGFLKWTNPWDEKIWHQNFNTAKEFYFIRPRIGKDNPFIVNIMSTIWDNKYYYVGMSNSSYYELLPYYPIEIRVMDIKSEKNIWNTVVPYTVVLPPKSKLPNNLTINEVATIVYSKIKDIPYSRSIINIEQIPNSNNIFVKVRLNEPYSHLKGKQFGKYIDYMVNVLEYPKDPIIKVNHSFKLPTNILSLVGDSINERGLKEVSGIIGAGAKSLIQVDPAYFSIIKSVDFVGNDFLGTIELKINVVDNFGNELVINKEIIVFGFIYIIPIILSYIIFFLLATLMVFAIISKRNKRKVRISLFGGYHASQSNKKNFSNKLRIKGHKTLISQKKPIIKNPPQKININIPKKPIIKNPPPKF